MLWLQEAIDSVFHHLGESRDFRAFSAFALAWFEKLLRAPTGWIAIGRQKYLLVTKTSAQVWEELMREIPRSLGGAVITLEAVSARTPDAFKGATAEARYRQLR